MVSFFMMYDVELVEHIGFVPLYPKELEKESLERDT